MPSRTPLPPHTGELTALDQAIGDGDHGINMKRGFDAVRADAGKIAEKPLAEVLGAIGMLLVMKVGGASGPLYGTLFMALGKTIGSEPNAAGVAPAFGQAVAAVKARGKSDTGQKTMLDVLAPVQHALEAGGADLLVRLPVVASQAADATVPMKAIRGRASFLGDRSIGHMDPGARSASIILTAVCRVLYQRPLLPTLPAIRAAGIARRVGVAAARQKKTLIPGADDPF